MFIIIITNNRKKVKQNHQGSSLLSPAHGCGGAIATIEFNNSHFAKKSGEARKQAGKKKKGIGENEFLPAQTEVQFAEGKNKFEKFINQSFSFAFGERKSDNFKYFDCPIIKTI